MKRVVLLSMTMTLFVACRSAYDKAMTSGKDVLENDDFDEASVQFQVALEAVTADSDAYLFVRYCE